MCGWGGKFSFPILHLKKMLICLYKKFKNPADKEAGRGYPASEGSRMLSVVFSSL